jgi:hypothetical protein
VRASYRIPSSHLLVDDIFDGANSYPPELHDSPVMSGLVKTAQISRLLFQHHTTPARATTKDHFFGSAGQNYISMLGPRLAAVGLDGRTGAFSSN